MKNILRIARIELSQLFYSPVAWIVLLVFIFQSGWQYSSLLERMERAQQMGQQSANLTNWFFSGFSGLFPKMQEYLYLYIPLLTMGLISRETHSGSIKLLYSSPIRVLDIVVGKYLAMISYCFILISVLLGIGVISLFTIHQADFWFIFSGIIGLYLLICAYSAIGLFMSSLTSYQVVAAISTLVVLAALNFIGGLWQDVDFVRDITYFLSMSGRAEESINGLLGSNDILYFLIVIVLFIGLTLFKLEFERRTISVFAKIIRYVGFLGFMLLIGYVSSRPQFVVYKDMTATASRTLTAESKALIKKIEGPVVITTYINLLDENYYFGLPQYQNNDKRNFDMYYRFLPHMRMEYVFYWAHSENTRLYQENPGLNDEQLARKMAKANKMKFEDFLRPEEINKLIDLKAERNRSVRTVSYNGKTTFLRIYDDLFKQPGEKEITAALKRLVVNPPRVGFVNGHGERSINRSGDRDYKVSTTEISFRYSLVNQGFDVQEVSLDDNKIDKEVDILVLADALTAYNKTELNNLEGYIKRGGNLLIAAEPGSQGINNQVLDLVGISLSEGLLVQKSANFEPSFVLSNVANKNWMQLLKNSTFANMDSASVTTPTVAALQAKSGSGFELLPVLVTQAASTWLIPGLVVGKTEVLIDPRKNEDKNAYPVAFAMRKKIGKEEQRIFVIGDADFMSNAELSRQNLKSLNFSFVTELFRWFSNGQFPIDTTREEPKDNKLLISNSQLTWIRWGLLGLLPGLIAISVSWMLISRKRR
ncbi:ABC-2 type transport system permease protein [Pedobacter sp. ok626]|uniref:Gldg family protein n=1 Tax=Pedobacter sp. ok626 TaxID=1761882 RepID=UPI0008921805|nr:Gldg family protein [Pedobacter sp. ok626]SDL87154.1 ABC-2 type transport system permease protein [Pedobacter sp. ok626]